MDTLQLGSTYSRYYARKAARDMCELPKTKIRPDFEFGQDDQSWTGPNPRYKSRRLIHIGLKSFDTFPDGTNVCQNDNEWHMNIRHVLTHEEGHVFHTTERAWDMAQSNGVKDVISYCYEKTTGIKLFARNDQQYEDAVRDLFMNHGLMINMDMVRGLVHMIINSIEDGRMERRMAASRPGFKADLRVCRGKRWMHSPVATDTDNVPDLDNPGHLLIVVCNQILSFATMGIWQKGYMDYIVGTKAEAEVKKLLPEIRAGVMSRSCKSGMMHAGKIIEMMCPLFYDACTIKDFPKALMNALKQIAAALPDMDSDGNSSTKYDADEHSEEQKEEDPRKGDYQLSTEDGDSSENKVVFNIFAEADEGESGDDGSENASGAEKKGGDTKNNSREQMSKSNKKDQNASVSGRDNSDESEDNTASKQDSAGNDAQDMPVQSDDTNSGGMLQSSGGAGGSRGQHATRGLQEPEVEEIRQAMKSAVEEATKESEYTQQAIKRSGKSDEKVVYDCSKIEDKIDISSICDDFKELFREYPLTEDLPVSIEQEALVIRRKYEEYFQSLRRPTLRAQRSGRIDLRSLTKVVTRNLDVFTQPGEDHSFSGCIEILVDRSGSMGGTKMDHAMEICAMLEEVFKGLIPLKITAFDMYYATVFEVIKNWEDNLPKNGCWNFLRYARSGGGTPTSEALLIAQKELLARADKHKLLILITDENSCNTNSTLNDVIRHVRASGIQLSAFYIEERMSKNDIESFKALFDNIDALAIKPEELSEAMLPVVKKFTHQK